MGAFSNFYITIVCILIIMYICIYKYISVSDIDRLYSDQC